LNTLRPQDQSLSNSNSIATHPRAILLMQTAFIGDVILATAQVEKLHAVFPEAKIDFLVKKGNESLLYDHPHLHEVLVFDKAQGKWRDLLRLIKLVRSRKYDLVINHHRFFSSGLISGLSKAKSRIGFNKNPLSFLFTKVVDHDISIENARHETWRNHQLIEHLTDATPGKPKLYPSKSSLDSSEKLGEYYVMAPASVWFTKQYPKEKWVELIKLADNRHPIHLIGAPGDKELCAWIVDQCEGYKVLNRAGELTLLESTALIAKAKMNFVNDSAPMHLASAMNAPVTAIYCSTVPEFGFGPLSDDSRIKQVSEDLDCRPCGLHGFKACPKGHFKCSEAEWGDDEV
jgi:ADP-heptose:LPS heptosyltransferase